MRFLSDISAGFQRYFTATLSPGLRRPKRRRRQQLTVAAHSSMILEPRMLLSAVVGDIGPSAEIRPGTGSAVSSNTGSTLLNGRDLNALIGADRFYQAGFTGTGVVVGNIEAGSIWNGHESLSHLAGYVHEIDAAGPQTGDFDRHATWVGMLLGGRPTDPSNLYQMGVAPNATLYSGSLATSWTPSASYTTSFSFDSATFMAPYRKLIETGVGIDQQTADVINSSWNSADYTASSAGLFSRAVDALIHQASVTAVFSAGNTGPGPNSVGGPAAGYNVITVGALTADTDALPYQSVADLSSRGFNDIFVPLVTAPINIHDPSQGTLISAVRAVVDLVAPGTGITSALYTGLTGGNTGGNDPTPGKSDGYSGNLNGSSFASPLVAGGAALLVDAARSSFGENTSAVDGRVIKSILQTSADKIPLWSNGQSLTNGVVTTTQSLDPDSGAGRLNLSSAWDVLLNGTADVAGSGSGAVQTQGWDLGEVSAFAPNDYLIQNVLPAGESLTATLNWYVDRTITTDNQTAEASFDNLDLEVWITQDGTAIRKVAESRSLYNNVEHLHFEVPETGTYLLRVRWSGEIWDLVNDVDSETYALSWRTTGLVDNGVPVANASAADVFLQTSSPHIIDVQFFDDIAIDSSSITAAAVYVTGPDDSPLPLTLKSVSTSSDSAIVTAQYELAAPGGTWDTADDGRYQIHMVAGQVFDDAGLSVPSGVIGSFQVQIVQRTGPDAFGYVAVPETFSFHDIRTSGTPLLQNLDDGTAELSDEILGDFAFTFYDVTYHSLFVSTNGLVTFETPTSTASNTNLQTGLSQPAIAVLWDDLSTYGSNAAIYWKLEGSGQNQRLIIQWDRVEFLNGPGEITFQLILNMSDNSLIMSYADLEGGMPAHDNGRSATTGIRSAVQPFNTQLLTSFNGSSSIFVGSRRTVRYFDPRPAIPVVLSPGPDTRVHRPELTWSVSEGAAQYEVWVNRVTAPAVIAIHERVSDTSLTAPSDLEMGTYRVWVRAISEHNDRSAWSAPVTFRINVPPVITVPVRLQPTARPTLQWQAVAGAASYDVWINNQSTGQAAFVLQFGVSGTSFTPANDLPFGDYRIWVRAKDVGGFPGAWSVPRDFAVACWPTLHGPFGTTLDHRPTFSWSALPGASGYQIQVRHVSTGQIVINQSPPGPEFTPSSALPAGVYDWWVRGRAGNQLSGWWSFAGRVSIAGSPVMTGPSGQSLSSTPTFSWQSVGMASSYSLFVQKISGSPLVLTFDQISTVTFQPQLPLQAGSYRAWVRAVSHSGQMTLWSRPVEFTVAASESLSSERPVLYTRPPTARGNSTPSEEEVCAVPPECLPVSAADEFA